MTAQRHGARVEIPPAHAHKAVLYTSNQFAYPVRGGPTLRTQNSIKALARVCRLHVVCRASFSRLGGHAALHFYRSLTSHFVFSPRNDAGWTHVLNLLGHVARRRIGKAGGSGYYVVNAPFIALQRLTAALRNVDEAGFLIDYARAHRISIIWFGYGNISYPVIRDVARRAPDLRLVCDTDSVWSRFVLREAAFQPAEEVRRRIAAEAEAKTKEERGWVEICHVTTAVSEVDAAYYRSLTREPERIRRFSNAIDLATYADASGAALEATRAGPSICLTGSFWLPNSPMGHAARWLLGEVMQTVWVKYPQLHLYIVGSGSDIVLNDIADARVTVTGFCESAVPYLHHADAIVVPLWFESGTRFKILEAGACSKPVVSTSLGAEGLPLVHGGNILIADTADQFAASIIRLLDEPGYAGELGANLRKLVSEIATIETLQKEGAEIIDALTATGL